MEGFDAFLTASSIARPLVTLKGEFCKEGEGCVSVGICGEFSDLGSTFSFNEHREGSVGCNGQRSFGRLVIT